MSKQGRVNFICPQCGENELCASQRVTELVCIDWYAYHGKNEEILYGDVSESEVSSGPYGFSCNCCGFGIGESVSEAFEWLETNRMLEEA